MTNIASFDAEGNRYLPKIFSHHCYKLFMLQAYTTESGTGITILGNYGDLQVLYETIHHLSRTLDERKGVQKAQHQLLMNFAYEVRKAYYGNRLVEKHRFDGDTIENTFYGFQLVWTDILIFVNVLRRCAGVCSTNKMHQAILYNLEYEMEEAMFEYDPVGAAQVKELIGQGINIDNNFAFVIYQAIHIQFVTDTRQKARFRKLPALIASFFNEWGQDYKQLVWSFQQSVKEQSCDIAEIEFADFPDIVW